VTRRRGDAGTRRYGDAETRGRGDTETRRYGDAETRRRGEPETRRRGDAGTRGRGDTGTGDEETVKPRRPKDELRRRAEQQMERRHPPSNRRRTSAEMARLIHELEVHQIELEMQNEELRQAHADVDKLLAQYTDLYDFAPTGYLTIDRDGVIRQVNLAGTRLLGVDRSRLQNRRLHGFVAEPDRRAFGEFLPRAFASHAVERCELALAREGQEPLIVRLELQTSEDGQVGRVVLFDLTRIRAAERGVRAVEAEKLMLSERARRALLSVAEDQRVAARALAASEAALRESEAEIRALIEHAPTAICELSADGSRFLSVNQCASRITGYSREELLAQSLTGLTDDAGGAAFSRRVASRLAGDTGDESTELRVRTKAGEWRDLLLNVAGFTIENGRPQRVLVIAHDITERKKAEALLAASEEQYRLLFELNPDPMWIFDESSLRFLAVNEAAVKHYGWSREEFLRMTVKDVRPPEERPKLVRVLEKQRGSRAPFVGAWRHWKRDRTVIDVEVTSSTIRFQGRDARLGMVKDVTERRRAEDRIAADVAALTRMHTFSVRALEAAGLQPLLQEAMDTAVGLLNASKGTLQLLEGDTLRIAAQRGHKRAFLEFFATAESVVPVCGEATRRGERVLVEDVEQSPLFAGRASLAVLRAAGVRAVLSTPLVTRAGRLLGVLTTHWAAPHLPTEQELWQLDLLTRQVADLIQQRQAEETLRESEAKYRSVVERASDGICVVQDGRLIYVNDRLAELGGYRTAELLGTEFLQHVHPDDRAAVSERYRRRLNGDRMGTSYEARLRVRGGGELTVEISGAVAKFDGRPADIVLIHDITERRRAEEALRASEARLRLAQHAAKSGTWEWDLRTNENVWSDELWPLYALDRDTCQPSYETWLASIHPDDRDSVARTVNEAAATGSELNVEWRVNGENRPVRWLMSRGQPQRDDSGQVTRYVGIVLDITERKRSEARIARLARLYAMLSRVNETIVRTGDRQSLLEGVCHIVSEEGGFPLVWIGLVEGRQVVPVARCGEACDYLNEVRVETDGELGRGPTGTAIREDRAVVNDNFDDNPAVARWRESALRFGLRASASIPLRQHGRVIGAFSLYASEPRAFDEEQVQLFEALSADVSFALGAMKQERRRAEAEQAMRASEEQFRRAIEEAPIPVIMHAEDGQVLQVSRRWAELTGYAQADTPTFDAWLSRAYGAGADAMRERMRELFGGTHDSVGMEFPIRTRDGRTRYWSFSASAPGALADGRRFVVGMAEDVTERRQAEVRLREAMTELTRSNEELEQFAYVASHDLQEPLRMVSNYVDLLRQRYRTQLDAQADKYIDYASGGARRMQALIADLLTFSRVGRRELKMTPVNLNHVLRKASYNLEAAIREAGAEVTADELPVVCGDESTLMQLFQNLIDNAVKFHGKEKPVVRIDAETRGHGDAGTRGRGDAETRGHGDAETRGRMVTIAVADNGIGMEPRHTERIFRLFQRLHTVQEYPGTGIGLAVCKRVVERHGGRIWVESEPGKGATFYFTLPEAQHAE
jgi:PAS domain S-box-containing protein